MPLPTVYFNGIDGETGDYLQPPATPQQVAALARGGAMDTENLVDAQAWRLQGKRGLRRGDPRKLSDAGWGVIFAQDDPDAAAIQAALQPLLALRRGQVGTARAHTYRELLGDRGYHAGDTKRSFLTRHGVGAGSADPDRMPYYLLIIGSPEQIPWEFQYELDMQYAVGRIWFETVEEYAAYARNVVAAETSRPARSRTAAFFGPQHPDDSATELSATQLAAPLAAYAAGLAKDAGWTVRSAFGDDATKARLHSFLGGDETPDFLFTAGHGMVFPNGDERQMPSQGAILCRDWPGPKAWHGRFPPEFYFGGADVNGSEKIRGMISFHFACYSAGGPQWDDYSTVHSRVPVAPHPFIASLPRRLLQAGALAVIGHVEKAWQCSIDWPGAGTHVEVFQDAVERLFSGHPVGSAMEPFGQRYAELGTELSRALEDAWRGTPESELNIAELWMNCHDARNYIVLGDPAVRLIDPEGPR